MSQRRNLTKRQASQHAEPCEAQARLAPQAADPGTAHMMELLQSQVRSLQHRLRMTQNDNC